MPAIRYLAAVLAACFALLPATLRADEFDNLRLKWRNMIAGTGYDPADSLVASKLSSLASSANSVWTSMEKSSSRGTLWQDAASTTNSADITTTYNRLRSMALALATPGCSLYQNPSLLADTISALDWMHANRYGSTTTAYGNWWDWQIGTPLALNDVVALLYDQLTAAQRTNYMAAIEKHSPTVTGTGANLVWKARVVAIRGSIVKNSAKLAAARDSFASLFPYVTSGDGFYRDGGFIQHGRHPYTGGYGIGLIANMVPLMEWFDGSSWEINDPNQFHVFRWVFDSFEPVIYRGAMWDPLRGREIARTSTPQSVADGAMEAILRLSQFAPPADAARMKSMLKHWALTNTARDFVSSRGLNTLQAARELMADSAVVPRGDLTGNYQFPSMDRVLHHAPGFAFGLSMCSKRIYNFESINGENLQGWFTGDGMTTLYNTDLNHYANNYWVTIDPYRLPGVTADPTHNKLPPTPNSLGPRAQGMNSLSAHTWVGGASVGDFGAAGMQLDGVGVTLTAKKSWFMFDDEIVCLGAGITSTDSRPIETTVENRRLTQSGGTNDFVVNGIRKPSAPPWSETIPDARHAWLAGNVAGSDIGYYFPQPAPLVAVREARTVAPAQIRTSGSTTPVTRNFLRMTLGHGSNPSNATYQYVLLPGRDQRRTAHYADQPHITVLSNNGDVQAAKENLLGITAANFWNNATRTAGLIKVNKKASVVVREHGGFIDVAVSDPTQANTGTITVELSAAASLLVSADPAITVTRLSPGITMSVATTGTAGRSLRARFFTGTHETQTFEPVADAYVRDGTSHANTNFGGENILAVKTATAGFNRESFLIFELPPLGTPVSSSLRLSVTDSIDPGLNSLSRVDDPTWQENTISWNNRPQVGTPAATWTPTAAGTDVTLNPGNAVASSGPVTLALQATVATSNGYVTYGSREHADPAKRPALTVTFARTPPAVHLVQPADGATMTAPGPIVLSADATATSGTLDRVDFFNGSTLLGSATSPPFHLATTLGGGTHWIHAVATDSYGLATTSASHRIDVSAPPAAASGDVAVAVNNPLVIDLRTLVSDADTPTSALLFAVSSATHGTVTLLEDGHTARFIPNPDYTGPASFSYSVTDTTPDKRLFLHYPFADTVDPLTDSSGNGRHGNLHVTTMTGSDGLTYTGGWQIAPDAPAAVSRWLPESLRLIQNGNDPNTGAAKLDRMIAPSELDFRTANWTVSGWFKRDNTNSQDIIFHPGNGSGASGTNELQLFFNGGSQTLELRNRNASTTDVSITAPTVPIGTWQHFAIVRSGNMISLYLNGTLRGSDSSFTITMDHSAAPVSFGGNSSTATAGFAPHRYLGGSLADLAVFDGALGAQEIARLASLPTIYLAGQSASAVVAVSVTADPSVPRSLVWDSDPATPAIQGGAGTWNSTLSHWWDDSANVTWNNTAPDHATFDAGIPLAANTSIQLGEAIRLGRLAFFPRQTSLVFAIAGSQTLTLVGTPEIEVTGGTSRIDAPLRGGFVKTGNGRLIIASNNPDFTETVTIQGDRLQFGNGSGPGSLGTAPIVNNATFVLRRTGGYTIANPVAGTGNVLIQAFSSTNATLNPPEPWTYSGTTTIEPSGTNQSGGRVRLGGHQRLPATTRLILNQQAGSAITLDLNGYDQTLAGLASGAGVNASNAILTNSSATAATLTVHGTTDNTCAALITGNIALVKDGSSRLTLDAAHTYTGSTTVAGGTLVIRQPYLAPDTSVTLAAGAVLQLDFTGDNPVGSITQAGSTLPPGRYNAAHPVHGASFAGTGSLVVGYGGDGNPDYDAWAAIHPGLTEPSPAADPDHDSLDNFTEYAFGLDPVSGTSANPYLSHPDANGVFRYTRRDPQLTRLNYDVLVSHDLVNWTGDVEINEAAGPTGPDGVQEVTVTLSTAPNGGRLFVRIRAR
jgi:hyaluronate lyase